MRGRAQARLQTTALLSAGALAVHELRYRIALGDDASSALASSGHGYLGLVTPLIALVTMLGLAVFVHRIAAASCSTAVRARSRSGGGK